MRRALIVVDVQHGFRNPQTEHAVTAIESLLARVRFDRVLATEFHNFEESDWCRILNWYGMLTDEDRAIAIRMPAHTEVITKTSYGLPTDGLPELVESLRGYDVYVVGLETDVCVTAIATQLFDAHLAPRVLQDCVGTKHAELQKPALHSLGRIVGRDRVLHSDDLS